jgi:hypothetical protein
MPDGPPPPFDDGPDGRSPLPPEDRLWRHPSELGRSASIGDVGVALRRPTSAGLVIAIGVGLGLVVLGTLALAGSLARDPGGDDDATPARALGDVVYVSSSTTTAPGRSGWLGISAIEDDRDGVTVTECDPGSPAERQLRPGDLIVEVDGVPTPRMAQLVTVLAASAPGHTARIRLVREERALEVAVVLGRQP